MKAALMIVKLNTFSFIHEFKDRGSFQLICTNNYSLLHLFLKLQNDLFLRTFSRLTILPLRSECLTSFSVGK